MARKHFETTQHTAPLNLSTGKSIEFTTRIILASRIQYYRKKEKLSQQELADKIGVTNKAISNWQHGVSKPDIDHVPALCKALQTTPTRLFGMGIDISAEEEKLLIQLRRLGATERKAVFSLINQLYTAQRIRAKFADSQKDKEHPLEHPPIHCLPVADRAAAAGIGDPTEWYSDPDNEGLYVYDSDVSKSADCIFLVNGDSMEPTYWDGDRVYVKKTSELQPGQIGIFSIGNEVYIKEFQWDGLHSHNKHYQTIEFNEYTHVVPIGLVIGKVEKEDLPSLKQIDIYKDTFIKEDE